VAVLRLAHEIDWGSGDHGPVRAVVLVAVRQTNAGLEHLAVLARLARRLVHEEFRAALLSAPDATAVSELVQGALV
jgi:PTS system fructose-specific IIA component